MIGHKSRPYNPTLRRKWYQPKHEYPIIYSKQGYVLLYTKTKPQHEAGKVKPKINHKMFKEDLGKPFCCQLFFLALIK